MAWIERIGKNYYVRDRVDGKLVMFACKRDKARAETIMKILNKKKAAMKAREEELKLKSLY